MGGGVSLPITPDKFGREYYGDFKEEDGPFYTYDITKPLPIKFSKEGPASEKGCPARTITQLMDEVAEKRGHVSAFRVERPMPKLDGKKAPPPLPENEWTQWNFKEYRDEAKLAAGGYLKLGFTRFDCVCIFGFNSPEWVMGGIGSLFAGGCFTGIYPSDTPDQAKWKALVSNSSIAIAETLEISKKFTCNIDDLSYVKAIVILDPESKGGFEPITRSDGSKVEVKHWKEVLELGKDNQDQVAEMQKQVRPNDCAELIFTSGTTGNPKAVMVSHDAVIFESRTMMNIMQHYVDVTEDVRTLSYLPLSHIAGSLVDIFTPIVIAADFAGPNCRKIQVSFARPYDLKVGSLGERLRATRPNFFFGVPRVWEKVQEKLLAVGKNVKGVKRKVANVCKAKALQYAKGQQLGANGKIPMGFTTAEKLILSKIKDALGLDQCKIGFTGAAPMKQETLEYFASIGICLNEVYGMSETCGVSTVNTPKTNLWSSVGYALPGAEVAVFKVDDKDLTKKTLCPPVKDLFNPEPEGEGEICFRGRHIMSGYLANPKLGQEHVDEIRKKNEGAMDREGWLHSGDKGCMNEAGMFRVTGRFKELIIGAGGENIAPVPIENEVMKIFHGISNIMMVGDKRKFNVALVTLKAQGATGELPGGDELDPNVLDVSPGITKVSEAVKDKVWIEKITNAIKAANSNGKVCPSNAAKIQKFTILPRDFSVQTEEFTATLKMKRSVVEKKFLKSIDAMYLPENKDVYVPFQE